MSVTQYTIPCRYNIPKLKDTVYFVSKSMAKIINIDNGTASVTINNPSPYPPSPSRLKGFNVKLTETESLGERYKFTKQLTMSITGHLTDSRFLMDDDYYIVVQTEDGTYYLVNVDFPSKMTYTYNLSEGQNQTDFTFTSNSNFPLLKLNWSIEKLDICKVYTYNGIRNLKLIEKGWAKVDVEEDTITLFDHHTFKDVDFNKASCTLAETYDGSNITNTISFDIPFDNTQSSWQYNLLEFKQNLYIAEILPKNSEHALLVGYENGLEPSYNVQGGTSNGDASKITITLEETSQRGLEELINWSVVENTNKKWVYIKEIDHKNAFTCIGHGIARYDYMAEVDQDGNELGNYKRFVDADASKFPYLNVVGTFDDEVTFQSSVCNCSDEYTYKFLSHYYCIDGDKVEALENVHTYDCGKSGTINGTGSPISDYTELGDVVESDSDFCEDEVEYMWVLKTDKSECVTITRRWVDSGYTCSGESGYDKYLVQKEQIWDDDLGWVDTDPLITAATLVEKDSEDCGFVPPPLIDGMYQFTLDDSSIVSAECDATSAITSGQVQTYRTRIVSVIIGDCARSIGDTAFNNCHYITSMTISNSVTVIGGVSLSCQGLLRLNSDVDGVFNLPNHVTSIGTAAFEYCYGLTSIDIPSGVTSISDSTFFGCRNLASVTIPSGVTNIYGHAFRQCYNLTSVTCLPTTPPTLGNDVFLHTSSNLVIYVPSESVETYKAAWSTYADRIQAIP